MIESRQISTTSYPITFFMALASDHITGAAGLTPVVTLSKNGGAFAAASGAVSGLGGGWYALAGNATDRNTLGTLAIHAVAATADNCDKLVLVVNFNPFTAVATSTTLGHTLADAMLDIGRLLGGLRSGIATGGSVTTLVDTARSEESEKWDGGTLWITSGVHIGTCYQIASFVSNTITLNSTLSSAITAGTEYSVLPAEFSYDMLKMAVQAILSEMGDVMQIDDSLASTVDDEYYSLPNGVYNIFRVELASNDASPYSFSPNYFWKELAGLLHFIPGNKPGVDAKKIRVWYKAPHAPVDLVTDILSTSVDRNWLKWAGLAFVLRNSLAVRGKDKPIYVDLLNQAMQKEAEYRNANSKKNMTMVAPDPRLNP